MNVLYGLHQPDEGEILLDGEPVEIDSPREAIGLGIGMVHQHFMLVPVMTVAENLVLGAEPRKRAAARLRGGGGPHARAVGALRPRGRPGRARSRTSASARSSAWRSCARCSAARSVLVLDEPTAVLTAQEAQDLFRVLRRAEARTARRSSSSRTSSTRCSTSPTASPCCGAARRSTRCPTEGATERSLARLMVGRDVLLRVEKSAADAGRAAARGARTLARATTAGCPRCAACRFEVRAGEIVGLAGVDANGQSELIEAIMGLRRPDAGQVLVGGRDVTALRAARDARRRASATSPRTATAAGWCSSSTWPRTSACASTASAELSRLGWLSPARMAARARGAAQGVRRARRRRARRAPRSLSGGNQQKVVIARELVRATRRC